MYQDWSLQQLKELSADYQSTVKRIADETSYFSALHSVDYFKKTARTVVSFLSHFTGDKEVEGDNHIATYGSPPSRKMPKATKDVFKLNLSINRKLGFKAGEGSAYYNLGLASETEEDFKQAIEYYKEHLTIARERADRRGEGLAYVSLGGAYLRLGDIDQAVACLKVALCIAKEVEERAIEKSAHSALGCAYLSHDKLEEAQDHLEQHLQISIQEEDIAEEGYGCGNLGIVYLCQGEFQKAVECEERFLSVAKETGNRVWEAEAHRLLGATYQELGEIERAMHHYRFYLSIAKEIGLKGKELGITYLNIGNACYSLRDFKQAVKYHKLHLNTAKEVEDRVEEGRAYGNLSDDYYCLNDFKQAIEYGTLYLDISKKVESKADEAAAYDRLGRAFYVIGDFQRALLYFNLLFDAARETEDRSSESRALGNIGESLGSLGQFKEAIEHHQRQLSIATEMGEMSEQGCANCCIGRAYQRMGDSKEAIAFFEKYLTVVKEEGNRRGEGIAYGNLGDAYLSLDNFERALHYQTLRLQIAEEEDDKLEQGNALESLGCIYELLEFLDEALDCFQRSVQQFKSIRALLQSRDEWKISFQDNCLCAFTALWRILLKQNKITEALLAADEGRAQSLTDLMRSHYGLPISLSESITREEVVLDVHCNILFLALDNEEKKIHVWLISENKDICFRTEQIETVQETNLKDFISSLYLQMFEAFEIDACVRCEDRSLNVLRQETSVRERSAGKLPQTFPRGINPLRVLYDIIVKPVADLIQGEELVIVPDGSLCLTPFCALQDSNSRYLCESVRLRVIPSLSCLRVISISAEECHSRKGALLVGDPCVRGVTVNGKKLEQLPYASIEVEMIAEILMTEPLTGTNATKDEVLRRLSSVALVHIAAHGSIETGEIALSPNPTRESRVPEMDDFVLTMSDVLGVQMGARLVVLSCCHSGQGEVKAEGVVGIARAFLASGARSVLVSLWAIDGNSASESLSQAMKCLRESEHFGSVKYWAPFVLIGDDVTLDFGKDNVDF